jgi:hypothetical protein
LVAATLIDVGYLRDMGGEIAGLLGSIAAFVLSILILRAVIASGVRKGTREALLDHAIFMEKVEAEDDQLE